MEIAYYENPFFAIPRGLPLKSRLAVAHVTAWQNAERDEAERKAKIKAARIRDARIAAWLAAHPNMGRALAVALVASWDAAFESIEQVADYVERWGRPPIMSNVGPKRAAVLDAMLAEHAAQSAA